MNKNELAVIYPEHHSHTERNDIKWVDLDYFTCEEGKIHKKFKNKKDAMEYIDEVLDEAWKEIGEVQYRLKTTVELLSYVKELASRIKLK